MFFVKYGKRDNLEDIKNGTAGFVPLYEYHESNKMIGSHLSQTPTLTVSHYDSFHDMKKHHEMMKQSPTEITDVLVIHTPHVFINDIQNELPNVKHGPVKYIDEVDTALLNEDPLEQALYSPRCFEHKHEYRILLKNVYSREPFDIQIDNNSEMEIVPVNELEKYLDRKIQEESEQ